MSCSACTEFSPPGRRAELIASDEERWTELYRCPSCGTYWEVGVIEWYARELSEALAMERYPQAERWKLS